MVVSLVGWLGVLLALVCIGFALRAGRRKRLIDNVPTSKTTGVFVGLVELKGSAETERPLTSYLAECPCILYRWSVREHWSRTVTETYTDSKGRTRTRTRRESGWRVVASGGQQTVFYLRDDCGVIRVAPKGATVHPVEVFDVHCGRSDPLYYAKGPAHAVSHSDHRRRFSEEAIPLHASLYVMGPARERDDVVAPEIRHDPNAAMFLISTRTEASISAGYRAWFWSLGLLAVVLAAAGWAIQDHVLGFEPGGLVVKYLAIAGGAALSWGLGWVWMAYNSLVNLRQRVRQAWANVDVQLKRRADLIPQLVRVVRGLRDHERRVQTELAGLRQQLAATAPGEAGPDPRGCVPLVTAVFEAYPELKADGLFLNLQRSLVEMEQRIALAREYFNDIATFYNTRLQVVPDRCVAALGRLVPQALIRASDFDRAPVRVDLATNGQRAKPEGVSQGS